MTERPPYILLLDMDGPIADFDQYLFSLCDPDWLDIDSPSKSTERYMSDHAVDRKAKRKIWDTVAVDGFYRNLPVTPGAREGVRDLIDDGRFDIWVCTKPYEYNRNCFSEKAFWLHEHFPELDDQIILLRDKTLAYGHVLLDDAPKLAHPSKLNYEPANLEHLWSPVIFSTSWNGPASIWGDYPHWRWGDEPAILARWAQRSRLAATQTTERQA